MKTIYGILSLALCLALTVTVLSGCGGAPAPAEEETFGAQAPEETAAAGVRRLSVVTTIFPEYDWVRQILGDRAGDTDLTMLLDSGVDLHSYQPSADDLVKVSECDLFIYVGGESDEWAEDALEQGGSPDRVVIDLMSALGESVKEEEVVEGMQAGHEHEDAEDGDADEAEHEHAEDGDADEAEHEHAEDGEEAEYDEHVWLSLKNAELLCGVIADALAGLDPDHADEYLANAGAYTEQLAALDGAYQAAVDAGSRDTVLFGDRFPFRYMTDDYGLNYYAAFVGCSAESEASFETVVFLAGKVDELGLPAILTIEGQDHKIAETVRDNTSGRDQEILTMDSLQSTTAGDVEDGVTYLGTMTDNLEVLKAALR